MQRTNGLKEHCDRCLNTERWNGSVVLMVLDAAFTSIGLNYFTCVVPKVMEFKDKLVSSGSPQSLGDLSILSQEEVQDIWRNKRSWQVARSIASYLNDLAGRMNIDDKEALRLWSASSCFKEWRKDPVGSITGVGVVTFQYLRMMGGIDTAMPDKIVRKVVKQMLEEAGSKMPVEDDMELIATIGRMSQIADYRPIEICWMTWLIQSEGSLTRDIKNRDLLRLI